MIAEYTRRDSRQRIGIATYTIQQQLHAGQGEKLLLNPEQLEKLFKLIQQLS